MALDNALALELANDTDFFIGSRYAKTRAELAYCARLHAQSLLEVQIAQGPLAPLLQSALKAMLHDANWLEVARKIKSDLPPL